MSSHSPAAANGIAIRPLTSEADFEACLALQRETWGDDFRELVPPALLKIAQRVGGIAAGAFDLEGQLLGFVFGLTGVEQGRPVHWSHMLAVTESLRSRGIGRRLKHYQRDALRRLGVRRMYWTYDPLVARNAHLNLNRLGARVVEYVEGMYGDNPSSRTDSVIGSDRFIVCWELDRAPGDVPSTEPAGARPLAGDALPDAPAVRIEVPEDIQRLKEIDPDGARGWRDRTRRAFTHYLRRGYRVAAFEREPRTHRCFYTLTSTGDG
jgi:predicted GNAT superfamily acetyltransferase